MGDELYCWVIDDNVKEDPDRLYLGSYPNNDIINEFPDDVYEVTIWWWDEPE